MTEFKPEMHVEMPDGSVWAYSLEEIARNRAENYADEFDGDVERSLKEDTWPLFYADPFEAEDWAANNMNESDMREKRLVHKRPIRSTHFQEGWINGSKKVLLYPPEDERIDENA